MKIITVFLLVIFGCSQYGLWFSQSGVREYFTLRHVLETAQQENMHLEQRNTVLVSEIRNLKQGSEAIEAHARNDLGMIKPTETFYRIIPKQQHINL